MKIRHILIFIFFFSFQLNAQHVPLTSQFDLNQKLINPSAFSEEDISVNLFYRNQWTGFQNAPQTMGINGFMKYRNMNFGLFVINDKAGVFEQNTIHFNYAYDLKLNEKLGLSLGISGGTDIYAINYQDLELRQVNDPFIFSNKNNTVLPDFNIGIYLHSNKIYEKKTFSSSETQKDFFVGISVQHILDVIIDNQITANDSYLKKHFNLIGGYTLPVNNELAFEANSLLKYLPQVPFQAEVGIKAKYMDSYWAGINYRSSNDIILKLGLFISDNFLIAYSFDLLTSKIPNKISHELVIGYRIQNQQKEIKY